MARDRVVVALAGAVMIAALALAAGITIGLPRAAAYGVSEMNATRDYIGLWVTEDGQIRQALLPSGRYVEARGHLEAAYQGDYTIVGTHIESRRHRVHRRRRFHRRRAAPCRHGDVRARLRSTDCQRRIKARFRRAFFLFTDRWPAAASSGRAARSRAAPSRPWPEIRGSPGWIAAG